uniref:Putative LOC100899379 [Metaseiulus occidentalis] n=1 Tax=Lepeophtheirus salmonis TaxID=72036 RepID=A0A0K2V404_LEPSM
MLIGCNIPLSIVNHPTFKKFMEKYTGKPIPSQGTIIKLMEEVGNDVIYRNTPIVNCEVRIISTMLRGIHTKLRPKLSVKSIKYLLILKWNSEFCNT